VCIICPTTWDSTQATKYRPCRESDKIARTPAVIVEGTSCFPSVSLASEELNSAMTSLSSRLAGRIVSDMVIGVSPRIMILGRQSLGIPETHRFKMIRQIGVRWRTRTEWSRNWVRVEYDLGSTIRQHIDDSENGKWNLNTRSSPDDFVRKPFPK